MFLKVGLVTFVLFAHELMCCANDIAELESRVCNEWGTNSVIVRKHQVVIAQTNYMLCSGRVHLSDTYVVIKVVKCVGILSMSMENHISGVKSKWSV